MSKIIKTSVLSVFLLAGATATEARGCLVGAAAGGVAGHFAHHPILGAAAGCAIGHHMAHRHDSANYSSRHHMFHRNT